MLNLLTFGGSGGGQMSTGSTSDSAGPPSEPESPFAGSRRHFWLASPGRHPVTWALAGVVLLTSGGVALIQQQPGGRARAQSVYCGLVTCAVLRSVADSSSAVAAVPHLRLALPSSEAPSRATVPTHTRKRPPTTAPARSLSPTPTAPSKPSPAHPAKSAPAPKPTATPAPTPAPTPTPTPTPRPPRWPWPPTWPWPGGPGGGGWGGWGGGGGRHAQLAHTGQRGYQPRHAHHL
jgi:hypothetical protein